MLATPDGTTSAPIPYNEPTFMAIAAFTAVAWYNVAELNIQVFLTFKRHRGLYFWSLIISSYGCVLHALGFLLKFFNLTTNVYISVTIITIGWYAMVTGQAIVLYSRLHLVVRQRNVLRGVLAMIIIDAICLHIPTTVLTYGSNTVDSTVANQRFLTAFNIFEKLQMTGFCVQEFIISGIYVWATLKLLRPVYSGRTRKVMMQLIWINLIIIAMDVLLLGMEYAGQYDIEATLKAMVYSIKLKLEFAVLNQLMSLANSSVHATQRMQVNDGEKSGKARNGRSKSTEYISKDYQRPSKRRKGLSNAEHSAAFKIPPLDRKCAVETKHMEYSQEPLPTIYTNPAACFRSERRQSDDDLDDLSPHTGLGIIQDPPKALSPSLTGSTIGNPDPNPRTRRDPLPPDLDMDNVVMPNGLLRSTRPSVTDWADGPDSPRPPSEEIHLQPFEYSPRSPGSVRAGRHMANRSMGLDFMTSALHEE